MYCLCPTETRQPSWQRAIRIQAGSQSSIALGQSTKYGTAKAAELEMGNPENRMPQKVEPPKSANKLPLNTWLALIVDVQTRLQVAEGKGRAAKLKSCADFSCCPPKVRPI